MNNKTIIIILLVFINISFILELVSEFNQPKHINNDCSFYIYNSRSDYIYIEDKNCSLYENLKNNKTLEFIDTFIK